MSDTQWWCPSCEKYVAPVDVTYYELHDVRAGGCGYQVMPSNVPPRPWWRKLLRPVSEAISKLLFGNSR